MTLALGPIEASACGGAFYMVLDAPRRSEGYHLSEMLYGSDPYGEYRPELLDFLYPLRGSAPEAYATLDNVLQNYSYDETPPDPEPGYASTRARLADYEAALSKGDLGAMRDAAAALVEEILDLPAPVAEPFAAELRGPVELLELGAALDGVPVRELQSYLYGATPTHPLLIAASQVRGLDPSKATALLASSPSHPRRASLRWLSMRHRAAVDIPDGWDASEIAERIDPVKHRALIDGADQWLKDYPKHPLADYVRLYKLRLHYLRGEADPAWAILFDLYERHPVRAANEMRFLDRQHVPVPSSADLSALPPEVAAALLPEVIDPSLWSALWQRSASEPGPWALPLQERLLLSLARSEGPLDLARYAAFPQAAAAPSETWSRLRALVVLKAGRSDLARDQLALLPVADPWTANLRARLDLEAKNLVGAASQPGLPADVMQYLVRIEATDEDLLRLADSSDTAVAWEARLALSTKAIADRGDYKRAAKLMSKVDPERAALYTQARSLTRSRGAGAAVDRAHFFREKAGLIFASNDVYWYRSLPVDSPLDPAITSWLTRSFATYYALVAYADWLSRLDVASLDAFELTHAREILREADDTYNLLLNYGSSDGYAWGQILPNSPPAVTIRKVGKEIRARTGS